MNYNQAAARPRSEKITLITCDTVERLKLFTLNGADYERSVNYFVVGVKNGSTSLTAGTLPLSLNQWHFNPLTKMLTINVGSDPKLQDISVKYRLFFSNAAVNLPWDMANGEVVEWEPYVISIGAIGQQLDEENTGIVLETSSSVDLINTDGKFDDIFDTLIWENQQIKFYSWFPEVPISERRQLFDGVIESKSFSESKVTLKVKDFVFRLKDQVRLNTFSTLDGDILASLLDTPKRRIYGQVDHIDTVSLDATLNGYPLTGTISVNFEQTAVTGVGTSFLSELSPEDEIIIVINDEEYKFGVGTIESDTSLTLGDEAVINLSDATVKVLPRVPYRGRNRSWSVAGHKLRSPSTLITDIIGGNVFEVVSALDFFAGDEITVNGIQARIRRITNNYIVTDNVVSPRPLIGNTVQKRPVQAFYFGKRLLTFNRDYQITNSTEAIVVLDPLAEFNLFEARSLGVTVTFTNSDREVSTSSIIDLRSILKTRDWIRSSNLGFPEWYEILEVKEQSLVLRTPFTGPTGPTGALIKNVTYVDENSLMTANCLGMEVSGVWMKTASDAVRHLILNDAGFTQVNETRFSKAKSDCDYILSIAIPESLGAESPKIRDVITNINESVFGSLYGDSSQNISYSILNAQKPELTNIIRDDDILSFTIDTAQKIANKVIVNYRPYIDVISENPTFLVKNFDSDFVDNLIGIRNTIERTLYIYESDKAEIIAQRISLFNSLAGATIKIKAKISLAQTVVNDKLFLSFDRLYKRYAGRDRRKLGTVTGIRIDSYGCEISVSDLSNVYNRIPSIAPNTALDYSAASDDDKLRWGYVLDDDTETADPSSEISLGANIIG